MKGLSKFVEYTFMVLLSVLFLVSVVALVYSFYNTIVINEVRESLRQLAIQTSGRIMEIYRDSRTAKSQPTNYTSILLKEIDLGLPTSVSKRNYEIVLVSASPIWVNIRNFTIDNQNVSTKVDTGGAKVIARSEQNPVVEVEYDVPNIDVTIQGKSENGKNGKLSYYRYNINGSIYDTIVLGEADILVTLNIMS
jgi:hypothetical protein